MGRQSKTERPPAIRWLIRRDMDEVLEIERRSYQFPWTEEEFLVCLRQRNCMGTVYESSQGYIHGFMIYELHKDTLRVLNLAVAPEVCGTGVGRAMVLGVCSLGRAAKKPWGTEVGIDGVLILWPVDRGCGKCWFKSSPGHFG